TSLLPAAVLAGCAGAVVAIGAETTLAAALGAGALGAAGAARFAEATAATRARRLATATRGLAGTDEATLPAMGGLGALQPVADAVRDLAEELAAAKKAATTDRLT